MYDREELAEVYPDFPRLPLLGLIDGVVTTLERGDPAEIQSIRDELALDRSRPAVLCPEDLLGVLLPVLDRSHPERPVHWHIHRALHIAAHNLEPRLGLEVSGVVRRHRALIERIAGDPPSAFLYAGLRIDRTNAAIVAHLRDWAGADGEVAACLARSPVLDPAALGPELLGAAATCALAEVCAEGSRDPDDSTTLTILVPSERAVDLVRWMDSMLHRVPEFLVHVRVPELPLRVRFGEAPEPGWNDRGIVFDVRGIGLPVDADADAATRLVLAIVCAHPHAAGTLPNILVRRCDAPSPDALCALAAASPTFLGVAIENGWTEGLRGAAGVLSSADGLDEYTRIQALLAIEGPAAGALAQVVDDMLRRVADDADQRAAHGHYLTMIADRACGLGLKFWEARLGRPGAFAYLWKSARIREALNLRPEPVYRLLRRAAERADERALGLEILGDLEGSAQFPLSPVADSTVQLLRTDVPGIGPFERFRLLARAGSAEALELLLEFGADDEVEVDALGLEAAAFDNVWAALERHQLVQARWLVEALTQDRRPIGEHAAQGVVDVLLQSPRSVTEAKTQSLLVHLVAQHRAALGTDRYKAALAALEPFVSQEVLRELKIALPRPVPELPWGHLFEADLGHLLPQLGDWFAAHVSDKDWMRVDVGKVLRPAVRARCRTALGEHGPTIISALGDRWPTRAAVEAIAAELALSIHAEALDRCADEAVPPVFRAALCRLPATIEAKSESPYSDEHWLVRWVCEEVWVEAPELLARHVLAVFEGAAHPEWRRGLALALVALREPCGTKVPGALTRASDQAESPEEAEFFRKQRDTFARASAAREQALPGGVRTRQALHRMVLGARRARGVA